MLKALVRIVERVDAGAPALVRKRRIGNHVIEGFELAVFAGVQRIRQGAVSAFDERRGLVVQDHVHPRQAGSGGVFFLAVKRDFRFGFIAHFQQQRARPAGRVIHGGVVCGVRIADADDLRHDAADFGGRVELAFGLSRFCGEVAHQVFVSVTKDVVTLRAVLAEIERLVFEDADEVGEALDNFLTAAQLARIIEVRHVG